MISSKKIIIVDDHKIVRDGVKAILLGNQYFKVIHEAASGQELIEALSSLSPDLILLDLMLPDISGLELIGSTKELCNAKVLILTAEMNEETICEAVLNGADGFLNKDSSANELIEAMKKVIEGEPYFGINLSALIHRSYTRKVKELHELNNMPDITDREMEVIKHIANGLSFKEVAEKLFISPRTVENHKNNLLQKLELRNTIELLKYAFKHKLVEL
jgi:DNA-binding NarL/FixJ family response regulator